MKPLETFQIMEKILKILIRVDASTTIGSGHVMRCIVLAKFLREKINCDVIFACIPLNGNMIDEIRLLGFEVISLNGNSKFPSLSSEICVIQRVINEKKIDLLICDHYGIDVEWEQNFFGLVTILVIDDLADKKHLCNILINQNHLNNFDQMYAYEKKMGTKLLLGAQYVLLQKEYQNVVRSRSLNYKIPKNILIFFGGSDYYNMTEKVLSALLSMELEDVKLRVVLGNQYKERKTLLKAYSRRMNVTILSSLPSLAGEMSRASLMVGAGGTSLWERFYLGLPSVVYATAHNQVNICRQLAGQGLIQYFGYYSEFSFDAFTSQMKSVLENYEALDNMSTTTADVVDGEGASRILQHIKTLKQEKS